MRCFSKSTPRSFDQRFEKAVTCTVRYRGRLTVSFQPVSLQPQSKNKVPVSKVGFQHSFVLPVVKNLCKPLEQINAMQVFTRVHNIWKRICCEVMHALEVQVRSTLSPWLVPWHSMHARSEFIGLPWLSLVHWWQIRRWINAGMLLDATKLGNEKSLGRIQLSVKSRPEARWAWVQYLHTTVQYSPPPTFWGYQEPDAVCMAARGEKKKENG